MKNLLLGVLVVASLLMAQVTGLSQVLGQLATPTPTIPPMPISTNTSTTNQSLISPPTSDVQQIWARVTSIGAPSKRTGHTAVWTGHEMLVWGGRDYTARSNGLVWTLD